MEKIFKFISFFDLRDVLVFGGCASFIYGIAQIYPPAAWIIGGAAFVAIGSRK